MTPLDDGPLYNGPYVTVRPVGIEWMVAIEPAPKTGAGEPRTFGSKHEAFGAARELWTANRLPLRDFTVSETARAHSDE